MTYSKRERTSSRLEFLAEDEQVMGICFIARNLLLVCFFHKSFYLGGNLEPVRMEILHDKAQNTDRKISSQIRKYVNAIKLLILVEM